MTRGLPTFVDMTVVAAEPPSPAVGTIARAAERVRGDLPAPTAVRMLRDRGDVACLVVTDDPAAPTAGTLVRDRLTPDVLHEFGSAFRKARHVASTQAVVVDPGTSVLAAARLVAAQGSPLPDLVVRGEPWGWVPAADVLSHLVGAFSRSAAIDAVTGVLSRQSLMETLESWGTAITRSQQRLVAVLSRVEDLQVVNEIAGRTAGDVVLAQVVAQIVAVAPAGCAVGRIGGGELLTAGVLPETSHDLVAPGVEALRQALAWAATTPGKLPAHLSRVRWPPVRTGVTVSARGEVDVERVIDDARLDLVARGAEQPSAAWASRRMSAEHRRPDVDRRADAPAREHKFLPAGDAGLPGR